VKENKEVSSKVALKKRAAILKAAMEMFRRHGFKRASVDLIAEEARVAKPTIYAHFADKEALFAAVCRLFEDQVLEASKETLCLPEPAARFTAFLSAKFTLFFEVVLRSPYSGELLDVTNDLAGDVIAKANETYRATLIQEIERSDASGQISLKRASLDAAILADALLQAGHGAEYLAKTPEEHRANLARLVSLILYAVLPS
jgi:AcrR family transcriptional regulator